MENSFKCQADAPNTLLIVDDDEMNREVLANIFAAAHSIETAENGREGLVSCGCAGGKSALFFLMWLCL